MSEIIEYTYLSQLKDYIESFINMKRSCGYIYNTEAKFLKLFDTFIIKNNFDYGKIDQKLIDVYSEIRETESINSRNYRVDPVRKLAEYINKIGGEAYICPQFKRQPRPKLYIPSKEELAAFFKYVDLNFMHYSILNHGFMYSVLFRLYYTTGLREMEGITLKWSDINWEAGKINVENGKNHQSRYVYVTDDFLDLLARYLKKMKSVYTLPEFIFPNEKLDDHVSDSHLRYDFGKFRKNFYNDSTKHNHLNIHRFRHCYVVHKLEELILNGENIDNFIMYLCRQLGHKSVYQTYTYIHSVEHMLPSSIKFITSLSKDIYDHEIRDY